MKIHFKQSLSDHECQLIDQVIDFIVLDYNTFKSQAKHPIEAMFFSQLETWSNTSFSQLNSSVCQRFNWNDKSLSEQKKILKEFKLSFLDQTFTAENMLDLNRILHEKCSSVRIQWAFQGEHIECLVGFAQESTIDEFTIYKLDTQIASSFRLLTPMVAMINQFEITLRQPCIAAMMQLKWKPLLNEPATDFSFFSSNPALSIGELLRQRTIAHYNCLSNPIESLTKDCETNVLYHELGHAIIQHHIFKQPYGAIAECFQVFSPVNGVITLLECFADLAPQHHNKAGILTYLWLQNHKDLAHNRALAMYFADIWFFDTSDTDLYEYSELLSLILVKALQSTPEDCLKWFSADEDSILMSWINAVCRVIDKFITHFFSKQESQQLFSNETYREKVKRTQELFEKKCQSHKKEIDTFIKHEELMLLNQCYTDLGYEEIFNTARETRVNALFNLVLKTLNKT